MKDPSAWQADVVQYLDGTLAPEERRRVEALLRTEPAAREFLRDVAEQAVTVADLDRTGQDRRREWVSRRDWDSDAPAPRGSTRIPSRFWSRHPVWAVAAALTVLIAGAYGALTLGPAEVARIADLGGGVQWVGDGGRVEYVPVKGEPLYGGTLETLAADAWATLAFRDGSELTISGRASVTVSDRRQKELYLRGGTLSADVRPQPDGKPMVIHTPTADLEVLGTRLTIEAEASSTKLNVSSGRVRLTRLADGRVADVPAEHQVTAGADKGGEFQVQRRPGPVTTWSSDLPRSKLYGDLWAEDDGAFTSVRAAPLLWRAEEKPMTLYLVVVPVSRGRQNPVVLTPDARLRVRGRLASKGMVYVGLTTLHRSGEFAGKFRAQRWLNPDETGAAFEIDLSLGEFQPDEQRLVDGDPSRFPPNPAGLFLLDWWSCTVDTDVGLTVAGVDLVPAPERMAKE